MTGQCVGSLGRATPCRTKRRLPSGVRVLSPGNLSTGIVAMFVCATVSRTEMLAECPLEIKALSRSRVMAIRIGKAPTGIWVTTWLVEVSITATSSDNLAGQKREWAKAEDAKAKAKSIVIISVFMFGLLSLLERSLLVHRMHTLWRWRCSKRRAVRFA